MEEQQIDFERVPKRPVFLTVLCILTLITTGFNTLILLFQLIKGKISDDSMEEILAQNMSSANQMREIGMEYFAIQIDKIGYMSKVFNENFYTTNTLNLLIVILGLFGAIFMLKGKKIGFHFYIIYSILALALPFFFMSLSTVPSFVTYSGLFISGLFVFMYSRNFKWLK